MADDFSYCHLRTQLSSLNIVLLPSSRTLGTYALNQQIKRMEITYERFFEPGLQVTLLLPTYQWPQLSLSYKYLQERFPKMSCMPPEEEGDGFYEQLASPRIFTALTTG